MKFYRRGFTLIELLVVISIISFLTSFVMGYLKSAREKGANGSVKSNLSGLRTQAEIFNTNTTPVGTYFGFCLDSKTTSILTAASKAGGHPGVWVCNHPNNANVRPQFWVAQVQFLSTENGFDYWCVDYKGNSKGSVGAIDGSTTFCP